MGFMWPLIQTEQGHIIIPAQPSDLVSVPSPDLSSMLPTDEHVSQKWPLGTLLIAGERWYRYAKMGAVAGVAGNLYQSVVPLAGHIDEAIDAPAVGTKVISFTPAVLTTDDLAANELADGWISIRDEAGEGHLYRIRSHPAILGATAGNLTLWDPIMVAPAAAATATVYHNKWRNVIIKPADQTAQCVGVAVRAVTANYYCWLQTKGPCTVLADGTLVIGECVRPSEDDIGAVAAQDYDEATVANTGTLGRVMEIGADTEYAIIDLMME